MQNGVPLLLPFPLPHGCMNKAQLARPCGQGKKGATHAAHARRARLLIEDGKADGVDKLALVVVLHARAAEHTRHALRRYSTPVQSALPLAHI